ncbi:MAG: UvrD-helicase domain-containing protein [Deltaproteobacteria bacterium]|nr:UvrD-helicase domain-containing protein [Deltaproteobacteria bacterium]
MNEPRPVCGYNTSGMWSPDDLNPPQREAVLQTEGPMLILAGAGSGKTRVITYRIAHLIHELGVDPWAILAVTFTNKAAREMGGRVEKLIGRPLPGLWIGTFHGVAARMLRHEAPNIGFKVPFSIYDDSETLSLLKRVIADLDFDPRIFEPKRMAWGIDQLKNRGLLPDDDWGADEDLPGDSRFRRIYAAYQDRLRQSNSMDFGDLLLHVTRLLQTDPVARERWQRAFSYVLVDEYQDTNLVQYRFIRHLAETHRNLAVVGDDDQSIYSWRGADTRNLRSFEDDFGPLRVVKLEQNYRSTAPILRAASTLIARNRDRKGKTLWTDRKGGEKVRLFLAEDEAAEADFVISELVRMHRESDREYHEFAIFYRTNAQSRVFEEQLLRRHIPYVIVGGMRFYERAEIKDALAYARLAVNPADDEAFLRVINTPARGIGKTSVEHLMELARKHSLPLSNAIGRASEALKPAAVKKFAGFERIIGQLQAEVPRTGVRDFIELIFRTSGLWEALESEDTPEAEARLQNLTELLNAAEEFEKRTEEPSLSLFLERVGLLSQADTLPEQNDRVTLMTVHMAKGLEFPVVFVTGLEEGLFPLERAAMTREGLEEERRLAYVGMTRAENLLYLTCAELRRTYGQMFVRDPSRFLSEIPEDVMDLLSESGRSVRKMPPRRAVALAEHEEPQLPATPPIKTKTIRRSRHETGEDISAGAAPGGPSPFRVQARVEHPVFGQGVIIERARVNGQEQVTVKFAHAGEKKMMVRFANLTVLPS